MNPAEAHALQLSIIQALELASEGSNLDAIHETIHRPRRDLSVLPQVGALVSSGLVEKVAHPADTANRAIVTRANARPAHSVRFRLTQDGRSVLATARDKGEVPPRAIEATTHKAWVDYGDRDPDGERE